MVEKIHDGVFRIHVPLPGSPLKLLNAYCIKGDGRDLLIDTGFNRPECREALYGGLEELGVRLDALDILVTHRHADHSGLAPSLAEHPSAKIFADPLEAQGINDFTSGAAYWDKTLELLVPHGFSDEQNRLLKEQHPGIRYVGDRMLEYTLINDGDELVYGERTLRVIRTPGHTPGHITLYEPALKLYISADHILGDITPNITRWAGVTDSLGDYLASLDKVYSLDVDLVLPGHRSLITDMRARIDALRQHHAARLDEVRAILAKGSASGYAVASQMEWSIRGTWEDFPVTQKWFAMGEALAHLDRLIALGEVHTEEKNGKVFFCA
ncbi:MAG: Hydroxyacylglutathione hydrolase [Desulfovibrio sp.]